MAKPLFNLKMLAIPFRLVVKFLPKILSYSKLTYMRMPSTTLQINKLMKIEEIFRPFQSSQMWLKLGEIEPPASKQSVLYSMLEFSA